MTMATTTRRPKPYWSATGNAELAAARDEYRRIAPAATDRVLAKQLLQVADEIDEELALRAELAREQEMNP
jgi:hypothetical protein